MKRVLCLLLVLVGVGLGAQTSLTPAPNLLVKSDSNGYLLVTPAQSTAPFGPLTPFNTIRLRTDSNGFLMTALAVGAGIDGTVPPGVAVGSVLVSAGVGLQGLWSASPTLTSVLVGDGNAAAPSLTFASDSGTGWWRSGVSTIRASVGGSDRFQLDANALYLGSATSLKWADATTITAAGAFDTILTRDAANTLAQRNGTNAQVSRLYNTFTDASNYERVNFTWSEATNRFRISSTKGGSGTARPIDFTDGATALLTIDPITATVSGRSLTVNTSNGVGLGYSTGAGGAITQITGRTTGVTLNTYTGDITLVSAAGSATPASFIVTDSAIVATDNVTINQKSGTDLYEIFVTNVAAGSFKVTFFTTGGTTTEQPVFHFSIIKGVIS